MTDSFSSQPHSVWLCPEPGPSGRLLQFIDRWRHRTGTAHFAPHVTLAGDLYGTPSTTLSAFRKINKISEPPVARVTGVGATSDYFMSLFLDLEFPASTQQQCLTVHTRLTGKQSNAFRPHISIAYGLDDRFLSKSDRDIIEDQWVGQEIRFDTLAIVASAKEVPIDQWHVLLRTAI